MKRKLSIVLLALVLALAGSVLFACGGKKTDAPVVGEVGLRAETAEEQGQIGVPHRLTYSVPSGSKVTTSVTRDGKTATSADYTFFNRPVSGNYTVPTIVFHTAGNFEVTVWAALDGRLGSGSVSIAVRESAAAVTVSDVSIVAAAGETLGRVGALHKLTYTAPSGSRIDVTAEKDETPTEDFEWDPARGLIVFGSAGHFAVTVTATIGEKSAAATAEIDVKAAAAPEVTLAADVETVAEDGLVSLTRTAVCAERDYVASDTLDVQYRASSSEAFAAVDPDWYTLLDDGIIPHGAGEWKIVRTVRTAGGATAQASAEFSCTPAALTLEPVCETVLNIPVGIATDVPFRAHGAVDKYDVTYVYNEHEGATVERGDGCSVRVTLEQAADPVVIAVTYTHKLNGNIVQSVELPVCAVENLAYAPTFAADPLDGMPKEVLTSMGHLLVGSAFGCDGEPLLPENFAYEVVSSDVTANAVVNVLFAGDDKTLPYVIVENFGNNTAVGSFVLKVTATDPKTGVSTATLRTFTVSPTTNTEGVAGAMIDSFIRKYRAYYDVGDVSYANITADGRQNMVLTRHGAIMHRKNAHWSLNGGNSDFACMDFASAAANCRLEFTFRVVAPNTRTPEASTSAIWLGIGVRTVQQTGWAGFFDLHVANGRLILEPASDLGVTVTPYVSSVVMPEAVAGATIGVRLDRHVVDNTVIYSIYIKTEESGAYQQYARATAAVSASSGNIGAPIAEYQFTHRAAGGCYAVEDVHISVL